MTASELIAVLQKYPGDYRVVISRCSGGIVEVSEVWPDDLIVGFYSDKDKGPHELIENWISDPDNDDKEEPKTVNCLFIPVVVPQ